MGTAFISFHKSHRSTQSHLHDTDAMHEIGKIVFRVLIETMERRQPHYALCKGHLDAAYGISYLYIGENAGGAAFDFGPAFATAVKSTRTDVLPDYTPRNDLSQKLCVTCLWKQDRGWQTQGGAGRCAITI